MDTLAERRLEVVRQHMASENDHDFDATIDTFVHPRYELIPTGQVFDGEDEVRAYFAGSRRTFEDQRNEPIALHATDAGVFAEFWLLGTHTGPLLGHPPTGREIRVRMVAFFEFAPADGDRPDGIVCERVYYDLHSILSQLGLAPRVEEITQGEVEERHGRPGNPASAQALTVDDVRSLRDRDQR